MVKFWPCAGKVMCGCGRSRADMRGMLSSHEGGTGVSPGWYTCSTWVRHLFHPGGTITLCKGRSEKPPQAPETCPDAVGKERIKAEVRGKEREARNHLRPSAPSAGNKTEARSKRQEIICVHLRYLRATKQRQGARGKKSSASICAICGKQNRGKEQEARNHLRPSALSAGNNLKSEI